MGNLTDIDYGVGKYLTLGDQTGVPQILDNTVDIENLHFKLATNNNFVKYNMVDGFIDAFQDTSGVDASASGNEIRDGSGEYYSGTSTASVSSSGGQAVTTDGLYTIHKFTSSGDYVTDVEQTDYELLVVGGGGAGGTYGSGGGGGAGGVYAATGITVTAATHAVVVGAGGSGSSAYPRPDGSMDGVNSTFAAGPATYTGYKGGMGGGQSTNCMGGSGYGSGGGAPGNGSGPSSGFTGCAAGTGGNAGGNTYAPNGASGGGGGGAGAAGEAVTATNGNPGGNGGAGGVGVANDILITDTDVYYGGGGGGGRHGSGTAGVGGNGGGAAGNANGCGSTPSGTANTGGGGGGAGGVPASCGGTSGNGGSGIVIIRRPTIKTTYNNLTLISNTQTAAAAPTTGRIVIFEEASTGTTTLDTDIKGWVSRDNGSNYDQVALTSQVVYATGKRILEGSIDFTMTASTNMRYKITTHNQASSKVTRVHGASMLWS